LTLVPWLRYARFRIAVGTTVPGTAYFHQCDQKACAKGSPHDRTFRKREQSPVGRRLGCLNLLDLTVACSNLWVWPRNERRRSHFLAILPLTDPLQRDFYAEMCRIERWSFRTLRAKIGGELFERTALSKKPNLLVEQELAKLRDGDTLTPDIVIRDP
jgi:hypothetical protein